MVSREWQARLARQDRQGIWAHQGTLWCHERISLIFIIIRMTNLSKAMVEMLTFSRTMILLWKIMFKSKQEVSRQMKSGRKNRRSRKYKERSWRKGLRRGEGERRDETKGGSVRFLGPNFGKVSTEPPP